MGCSTPLRPLLFLITLRVGPVGRVWRLFNSWVVSQLASENLLPAANQCTAYPGKRRWQHGRRPWQQPGVLPWQPGRQLERARRVASPAA